MAIKTNDDSSLSHTRWNCKYHIVFIPKYRRKEIYGQIKSVDEDYMSMEIKVYLSYVDVMREVKDTFNMVTDQSMGYLN